MSKRLRHQRIVELVAGGSIHSQEELRGRLQSEGFEVTQSTLSRDIKELGLVKGGGGYRTASPPGEIVPSGPPLARALEQYLLKASVAGHLVVLRTAPGNAQPLAVALDRHGFAEILGSVAGDDTVLIVMPSEVAAGQFHDRLTRLAHGKA